jgi:hypothetical protein
MSNRFGFFRFPLTLEEVYATSLEFWRNNNGRIIEEVNPSDGLIKILKIQRGMSLSSNGEQYVMNFKFNEYEATTYVAIAVTLSFGYGFQWLTPKKLIKQWGKQFDPYGSFNLVRNGDINAFFDFMKLPTMPKIIKNVIPEVISKAIPREEIKKEMNSFQPQNVADEIVVSNTPKVKLEFCTNCGAEVREEHRFCVNCGYKLKDSVEF